MIPPTLNNCKPLGLCVCVCHLGIRPRNITLLPWEPNPLFLHVIRSAFKNQRAVDVLVDSWFRKESGGSPIFPQKPGVKRIHALRAPLFCKSTAFNKPTKQKRVVVSSSFFQL